MPPKSDAPPHLAFLCQKPDDIAAQLEKWEQGETIPNDQAAALILMVRKYPDTLQRLMEI